MSNKLFACACAGGRDLESGVFMCCISVCVRECVSVCVEPRLICSVLQSIRVFGSLVKRTTCRKKNRIKVSVSEICGRIIHTFQSHVFCTWRCCLVHVGVSVCVQRCLCVFHKPFWLRPFLFRRRVARAGDEFSLSVVHPCSDGAARPARDGALERSRTDGCRSFVVHDLQLRSGRAKAQSKPVQKPNRKVGQRPPTAVQPQRTESHERQRRSPAEVRALATTKIARIRAAIASLGPDDTEERASLEAALARAEHLAYAEAFIARAKKRIAAESAKVVEAEKQKQIFEQELAQAKKDLVAFRQEAGMQGSVRVGGRALASPRRAGSEKGGRTRGRSSMWTQRQTGLPHQGACSDSTHANSGSSRVECMVGRTSCRIARRILEGRQHSCSEIEHQAVGRGRAHGRDDRRVLS